MSALWVVIPAAGSGKRFGAATPKQYQSLLGKTVLEQTVARFSKRSDVAGIVIAIAPDDHFITSLDFPSHVYLVHGGKERSDSVLAALEFLRSLTADDVLVAVHDAARPCIRQSLLNRLFATAQQNATGVLPVLMAKDTIKEVVNGKIVRTLDRNIIAMAQTPQVFRLQLLHKALLSAGQVTDDASAVEQLGLQPTVIEGDVHNIKITLAQDLAIASAWLAAILQEND